MMSKHSLATLSALAAALFFWGLSFVWTKIVLAEFSPFVLVFLRCSLASLLFVVVLLVTGRGLPRLGLRDHGRMMLVALFQPFAYFSCETLGLQLTSASSASLIVTTIPVVVLVLSAVFLKERITGVKVCSVFLSACGVGMLVVGAPDFTWRLEGSTLGNVILLGAVLAAAGYIVLARRLGRSHSAMEITFLQMAYGSVFFLPFFLLHLDGFHPLAVSAGAWAGFAFLALLCSFGAFLCYNFALGRMEASRASVSLNGVPLVTVLAAWAVLGERLTLAQGLGGVVVLTGVLLPALPLRPAVSRFLHSQESKG